MRSRYDAFESSQYSSASLYSASACSFECALSRRYASRRPMASRRAATTCFSFSMIACSSTGDSGLSSAAGAAGAAAARTFPGASSANASAIAAAAAAVTARLFVVRILIRPVLTLERPVLLVVAHQPFQRQLGEHVGRVTAVAQVGDLDLQLLLLADDGVDQRQPRLAQHAAQARVQIHQRRLGDAGRGGDQAGAQLLD